MPIYLVLRPAVSPDDQTGALRHGDRVAPPLVLNDRGKKLDLVGAVPIRVGRVRFEVTGINEPGVGAVNGNAHGRGAAVNLGNFSLELVDILGSRSSMDRLSTAMNGFVRITGSVIEFQLISWPDHGTPESRWMESEILPPDPTHTDVAAAKQRALDKRHSFVRCGEGGATSHAGWGPDRGLRQPAAEKSLSVAC